MKSIQLKPVRVIWCVFVWTIVLRGPSAANTTPDNGTDVLRWAEQHFAKGKIPPFSFVYGGKKSERN